MKCDFNKVVNVELTMLELIALSGLWGVSNSEEKAIAVKQTYYYDVYNNLDKSQLANLLAPIGVKTHNKLIDIVTDNLYKEMVDAYMFTYALYDEVHKGIIQT
jgi:hypothetical protein